MTSQDFIDAGYARWDPPKYENCITDIFQKCIKDENNNKKYFITVERWDYSSIANSRHIPIRFEASVQLTHKATGEVVNIDCLSGWSIEDMEKYYEDQWNTGWYKYYEVSYEEIY